MKATNGMLQKKVLSVKGGHDYIIAVSDVSLSPKITSSQSPLLVVVALSQSTMAILSRGSYYHYLCYLFVRKLILFFE